MQLLPGLSAEAGYPWSPEQLLAFGDAALAWLKQEAAQHTGQQLSCSYDPGARTLQAQLVPQGDMPQRLQRLLSG